MQISRKQLEVLLELAPDQRVFAICGATIEHVIGHCGIAASLLVAAAVSLANSSGPAKSMVAREMLEAAIKLDPDLARHPSSLQ